jgi:hypothetical protein
MGLIAACQMRAGRAVLSGLRDPRQIIGARRRRAGADAVCDAGDVGMQGHGSNVRQKFALF